MYNYIMDTLFVCFHIRSSKRKVYFQQYYSFMMTKEILIILSHINWFSVHRQLFQREIPDTDLSNLHYMNVFHLG